MKWNAVRFKAVCRTPITRANIRRIQDERAEAGKEPATVEEIVNEFVVNHQAHHTYRAQFLMR